MSREPQPVFPGHNSPYPALLDIGRTLTGILHVPDLYHCIYEQTSRILDTTALYITTHDPAADEATIVLYADHGRLVRPGVTYRGSDCVAIRDQRPVREIIEGPDPALSLLRNGTDAGPIRRRITAPMMREGRALGTISVLACDADALGDEDLALLTAIADMAAVALSNARHLAEVEEGRRDAERLEEVGRALTSSLDLGEVLDRIVEVTLDMLGADGSTLWLSREGRAEVVRSAGAIGQPEGTSVEVPAELHDVAMRQRAPLIFDHTTENPLLTDELRALVRSASAMASVLVANDELLGALSVTHREPHPYGDREIRLFERLTRHANIAIGNARLHERMRSLSLTDPLTQLANRRHMEIFLKKEFAAARRGRPLTVILFDLDDFKAYNDEEGHQAGDIALRTFGEILASQTRAMNLAARYGGDEFIAILSGTPEDGARVHLGRIIEAAAADPSLCGLGISAGVAAFSPEMENPQDLVQAADRDLYACKRRHQVGR